MNLGARPATGWSHLPSDAVSKDIAPGWLGPGTSEDYKRWKQDCQDWKDLCSYDTARQQVKAITFRVPASVKQIIQGFPELPRSGPEAYVDSGEDWAGVFPGSFPDAADAEDKGKGKGLGRVPAEGEAGGGGAPGSAAGGTEGAGPSLFGRHTDWTWFWKCMDIEYDRPEWEHKIDVYGSFYAFVRTRGVALRTWLPEHKNRWGLSVRGGLSMNLLGRTYWLLRNARLTRDQRRWCLLPVGGDLGKYEEIVLSSTCPKTCRRLRTTGSRPRRISTRGSKRSGRSS